MGILLRFRRFSNLNVPHTQIYDETYGEASKVFARKEQYTRRVIFTYRLTYSVPIFLVNYYFCVTF